MKLGLYAWELELGDCEGNAELGLGECSERRIFSFFFCRSKCP